MGLTAVRNELIYTNDLALCLTQSVLSNSVVIIIIIIVVSRNSTRYSLGSQGGLEASLLK